MRIIFVNKKTKPIESREKILNFFFEFFGPNKSLFKLEDVSPKGWAVYARDSNMHMDENSEGGLPLMLNSKHRSYF